MSGCKYAVKIGEQSCKCWFPCVGVGQGRRIASNSWPSQIWQREYLRSEKIGKIPCVIEIKEYISCKAACYKRDWLKEKLVSSPRTRQQHSRSIQLANSRSLTGKLLTNVLIKSWNRLEATEKDCEDKNEIKKRILLGLAFNFLE